MEELKCIRNIQKSLPKVGLRKIFMERGGKGSMVQVMVLLFEPDMYEKVDDEDTANAMPIDTMQYSINECLIAKKRAEER